jgi:hypothetical protein
MTFVELFAWLASALVFTLGLHAYLKCRDGRRRPER